MRLGLTKLEMVFYGNKNILADCVLGVRKSAKLEQPVLQCRSVITCFV